MSGPFGTMSIRENKMIHRKKKYAEILGNV